MKRNNPFRVLILSIFTATALISKGFSEEPRSYEIKEAPSLSQDDLQAIFQGSKPNTVVHFAAGDTFPLQLELTGDFFQLNTPAEVPVYSITIKKDLFFLVPEAEQFLISLDGETWKDALEMVTGSIHMGFGKHNEADCFVLIGGELYERH